MRRKRLAETHMFAFFIMAFIAGLGGTASSQEGKANPIQFTLFLGVDEKYISYNEVVNGVIPDSEKGLLTGLSADLTAQYRKIFLIARTVIIWPNDIVYEGFIQDVMGRTLTPITTVTVEQFYWGELALGYDAFWAPGRDGLSLAPIVGMGYRYWIRGLSLNAYQEHYSWAYLIVGESLSMPLGRFHLGVDASIEVPILPQMATLDTPRFDAKTYPIKSLPGYRVGPSLRYRLLGKGRVSLFIYLAPYFQEWNIEGSVAVLQTHAGVPIQDIFGSRIYMSEPSSKTQLFGVKMGIGTSF